VSYVALAAAALALAAQAPGQMPRSATKTTATTLTVALDETGEFKSVSQAVDSLPATGGTIRIRPGVYRELIRITKPNVRLIGLGKDPGEVVLTYNLSHYDIGTTFGSASTDVSGDDFYAENLTFQNSFTDEHPDAKTDTQAVALHVTGDRAVFRRVRFLGYQDTLYADNRNCRNLPTPVPCLASREYFSDCYIEGGVDFIFGDAKAVFENCELHGKALRGAVYFTAQSKFYPQEDSGYVFDHCKLTAEHGLQHAFLGRPWRVYSTVVYLNTEMDAPIDPAGWLEWMHDNVSGLATAYYAEYNSTGPGGDTSKRVPQAKVLNASEAAAFDPHAFLAGPDHWDPAR
jgi:pectin methylesterase-like acyl-CoA thioesterase